MVWPKSETFILDNSHPRQSPLEICRNFKFGHSFNNAIMPTGHKPSGRLGTGAMHPQTPSWVWLGSKTGPRNPSANSWIRHCKHIGESNLKNRIMLKSSPSFTFKTSIFPRSARVRRSSRNEAPPHIPEHCPFSMQTKHLHILLHTFIPSLPPSTRTSNPLPPPHFYRLTPNHPHSYVPHAQTTPIYPTSPPHPCSVHPEVCTNPHCASYPSATLRASISPSSVPFSPGLCRFAFFIAQVSVPYVNALWTQALYIFPFMRYDAPWLSE